MLQRVRLTADLVEAFAGSYLSPRYDNPAPTPAFHRNGWELYCSDARLASLAAPRTHAKSTAFTHDFGLANILFRQEDYVLIASSTEELAIGHLGDIANELRTNDELIRDFQVKGLLTDSKTDVIVEFTDGHQARLIAKGSGQRIRGIKWNGKRPGLILGDDLEEDEQVENRDRREKFRRWVYRALIPTLRRGGRVRFHGTILHEDALLARTMKSKSWRHLFFKAHAAFDDFSDLLWPEAHSEKTLRAIRQEFIDDGDSPGYSQEYLNDPQDNSEAYLRKVDFLPMRDSEEFSDYNSSKRIVAGADFAVSKEDRANRTSFTIAGQDTAHTASVFDQYVGRWDTLEWIELLFDIEKRHHPEVFFVEDGVIWKSVSPIIYKEMLRRNEWINFQPIASVKDKAIRGRDFQKMHRAGAVRFDKTAEWYPGYEAELLKFTGYSEATLDDQFDSTAILFKGLNQVSDVDAEDFLDEEELEMAAQDPRRSHGRNKVTGY
jgi:predicted phage terminase large subunit-like protein